MDETRLCPSSFTHRAPLNETSGIPGQNHPRNLLDGDMDMNNFLPWPQQAAGGTIQSTSYTVYSHYRTFTLHNFRGCLGHLLICSILISAVVIFFSSTCTLSSSWKHNSTNLSADDTSWGEQPSVICHLDGTLALAFPSIFSHWMIFADKSFRIRWFLPPWYLSALGADLHSAAEPEPASANLRVAGCCLFQDFGIKLAVKISFFWQASGTYPRISQNSATDPLPMLFGSRALWLADLRGLFQWFHD